MTGSTHISFGILCSIAYTQYTNDTTIPIIAGAILGSVAPDIDNKQSWISSIVPGIDYFWNKSLNVSKKMKLHTIHNMLKHRGFTHSIYPVLILLWFSQYKFLLGIAIGWSSHILIDMFNRHPIRLFYPIEITTGEWKEYIVHAGIWGAIGWIIYNWR